MNSSRDAALTAIRAAQNPNLTAMGAQAEATTALAAAVVYLGDVAARVTPEPGGSQP